MIEGQQPVDGAAAEDTADGGGWRIVTADALASLPAGAWEGASADAGLFFRRDYLDALDRAAPENLHSRYALVRRGAAFEAALSAQLLDFGRGSLPPRRGNGAAGAAALAPLSLIRLRGARVLMGGSVHSCGPHGAAFRRGAESEASWSALAEALVTLGNEEGLHRATDFLLMKDVPTGSTAAEAALRGAGFQPVTTEPNMVLALDPAWRTHSDYLGALASKYRRAAERVLRLVDEARLELETLDDIEAHSDELHRLYAGVQGRARLRPVVVPPAFLREVAVTLGEDQRCLALRDAQGSIAGFVMLLRDGDTAVGYLVGFDPETNARAPVYLRLLHAIIEQALAWGCRQVSFGRTALDPKARLGAEAQPLRTWARHRFPALHNAIERWVLSRLCETLPERRPFG